MQIACFSTGAGSAEVPCTCKGRKKAHKLWSSFTLCPLTQSYKTSSFSDVPVCKNKGPVVHGVGKGEMLDVVCEVTANPVSNVKFHWTFNNSADYIHVPGDRLLRHFFSICHKCLSVSSASAYA